MFFSSSISSNYKISKSIESKHKELENLLTEKIPLELIPKLGFANCGTSYNIRKDVEISYIHIFTKEIFNNPKLLESKEDLIYFIKNMNINRQLDSYTGANVLKVGIKNILLFLLIPEKFEPIVSYADKEKIVKGFGRINDNKDIDENLELIREKYSISNSFYDDVNIIKWQDVQISKSKTKNKSNKLKVVIKNLKSSPSKPDKFKTLDNEDLQEEYQNKLNNGQKAEEIVYSNLEKNYMFNKKLIGTYIKNIMFELETQYDFTMIECLRSKPLKEISMFSTYVHTKAPFDLIYTDGINVKYVEVKSCSSKPYKVFMSINELYFAYENIENYELKVVIDNIIYDIDDFPIEQLYREITTINSESLFTLSDFEIYLEK